MLLKLSVLKSYKNLKIFLAKYTAKTPLVKTTGSEKYYAIKTICSKKL